MEPSGWCHFNFWSPNRSKTRPPYLPLPSLFFLSLSHPHLGGRGLPAHGTVYEGGRAAGPGTGGPGPRGTGRRGGTCCSGLPSRLSQLFRSGRLEAWRESWDVSALPSFAFEWAGWQRGDRKSGKQGQGFRSRCGCLFRRIQQHLLSAYGAQTQAGGRGWWRGRRRWEATDLNGNRVLPRGAHSLKGETW